jgi:hypothetical protein
VEAGVGVRRGEVALTSKRERRASYIEIIIKK